MSNSAHLAIRNAVAAALLAAPALAAGNVVTNRRRPMPAEVASHIFVYLEDSLAAHDVLGLADWRTRIRIECLARATAMGPADDAADALAVAVHARLLADPGLGFAAIDTEVQALAWTEDDTDPSLANVQAIYSVWHRCPSATLAA